MLSWRRGKQGVEGQEGHNNSKSTTGGVGDL